MTAHTDTGKLQQIKNLIEILNISQSDFSRQTDIDTAYLSRLLNGKKAIGPKILNKIILTFNVNRRWLETGEGDVFSVSKEEKNTNTENAAYISIPKSILDIMQKQAESLASKDKQIDELILLIKKKEKENAHQEKNAECADAKGF